MARLDKVGSVATTIYCHPKTNDMVCVYHQTNVVTWNNKTIILNTGGWKTYTTKTRMNQVSNQFGLGYSVFQVYGDWFIEYKDKTIPFSEKEIVLERS